MPYFYIDYVPFAPSIACFKKKYVATSDYFLLILTRERSKWLMETLHKTPFNCTPGDFEPIYKLIKWKTKDSFESELFDDSFSGGERGLLYEGVCYCLTQSPHFEIFRTEICAPLYLIENCHHADW